MNLNSSKLFQLFKYAVYALLAFNIVLFYREESLAAVVQFPGGTPISALIQVYASTIDTIAWVILLLMFELETFVLEDQHYNKTVTWTLKAVRAVCYSFIVYAFYGYVENLVLVSKVVAFPQVSNLCTLAADGWTYAIDLGEYTAITSGNCQTFSDAISFLRYPDILAVVDAHGLQLIRYLAWADVINAFVWILIVIVLEIDVQLQERNRFEGATLRFSNRLKILLYSILFLAAIYWGLRGDFVDFWDAFLWLVAFIFIELNVFDWRQEIRNEAMEQETESSDPA